MATVKHILKTALDLKKIHDDEYEAKVTVTITDTCYKEGPLKHGLPPGMAGIPETAYLTFDFVHEGEFCGQIVHDVTKTIKVSSAGKRDVTVFVVVNGEIAGEATKPFLPTE